MRRRGGLPAWLWLLGSMLSMFTWRIVNALGLPAPAFFNPLIAIWGSSCLFLSMFYFGREISNRRRAEEQRDVLLASERAAREQAERANRLKDQFLGALSHELRTPLTAILGWCELLQHSDSTDPQVAEAVATIQRNARAQARLIEDLLDMTRINAGTLSLDLKPIPAAAPVLAAIETIRPAAQARQIHIRQDIDPAVRVLADSMRLQQIVWNLLANAVKFTPQSGEVRVTLAAAPPNMLLTVSDTGEGIPADFLPHLFTRFRQVDGTTARRHGGLGLGLSIVKSLVELHGGSVKATSPGLGRGATFEISLPLAEAPAPAGINVDATTPAPLSLRGLKVMVVEDEPDLRAMIAQLLERAGAVVQSQSSARDALVALESFDPDVLVSDIGMPGQDGYSMLQEIRRRETPGRTLPAIALTAYARDVDRQQAIDSGFQAHIAKPIDHAQLLSTVARFARNRFLAGSTSAHLSKLPSPDHPVIATPTHPL